MRGSEIDIENSGGNGARASNQRNGKWKDAHVLARHSFFRLRFGLASAGLTTEKHVDSDEKKQEATCYVECIQVNAEPVEQETSNQGEKRDDTSANECCSRDNELALCFTEMSGQCDYDGRKSDWINDGEECDKCANGECECCCCHGSLLHLWILDKVLYHNRLACSLIPIRPSKHKSLFEPALSIAEHPLPKLIEACPTIRLSLQQLQLVDIDEVGSRRMTV